jgi:alcohol dehydrogenase (cytochrome c)
MPAETFSVRRCVINVAATATLSFVMAPIQAAEAPTADWRMYNGNYNADRFSPLSQITRENVNSITEVGRYELPETTSFQTGPVVINGVLFVTTATGT